MYDCPRAATVTAKTNGRLWALDRATFRCASHSLRLALHAAVATTKTKDDAVAACSVGFRLRSSANCLRGDHSSMSHLRF
eukprot:8235680-Pyramimonas_sp.AAC.2